MSTTSIIKSINFNQVSIEKIDNYIEELYSDDHDSKIRGCVAVLYLCYSIENMEYMLQHGKKFKICRISDRGSCENIER